MCFLCFPEKNLDRDNSHKLENTHPEEDEEDEDVELEYIYEWDSSIPQDPTNELEKAIPRGGRIHKQMANAPEKTIEYSRSKMNVSHGAKFKGNFSKLMAAHINADEIRNFFHEEILDLHTVPPLMLVYQERRLNVSSVVYSDAYYDEDCENNETATAEVLQNYFLKINEKKHLFIVLDCQEPSQGKSGVLCKVYCSNCCPYQCSCHVQHAEFLELCNMIEQQQWGRELSLKQQRVRQNQPRREPEEQRRKARYPGEGHSKMGQIRNDEVESSDELQAIEMPGESSGEAAINVEFSNELQAIEMPGESSGEAAINVDVEFSNELQAIELPEESSGEAAINVHEITKQFKAFEIHPGTSSGSVISTKETKNTYTAELQPFFLSTNPDSENVWIRPFLKTDIQLLDLESPIHLKLHIDFHSALVLRLRNSNPSITIRINPKGQQIQVIWGTFTVTLDVLWTSFTFQHTLAVIEANMTLGTTLLVPTNLQYVRMMADRILFGKYKQYKTRSVSTSTYSLSIAGLKQNDLIEIPSVDKNHKEIFGQTEGPESAALFGSLFMFKMQAGLEHWNLGHNTELIFTPRTGEVRITRDKKCLIVKKEEVSLRTVVNGQEPQMTAVIKPEKGELIINNSLIHTKDVPEYPNNYLTHWCIIRIGLCDDVR
ncbi:hypothetical protein J6590_077066 [Homalodisca vitripennis]|nr:hypothetical protein J6590_077066 [Homalodisca vitripennis]